MARPRSGERRPGRSRPPHIAALEVEAIVLDYIPNGLASDPHREHRSRPVVQALGLRQFHLVDGIPVTEVDLMDRVTLAREVSYEVPIYVRLPTGGVRKARSVSVRLSCIPGSGEEGGKSIYCYPIEPLDPAVEESLREVLSQEKSSYVLVSTPEELARVAEAQGKPGKIISTPRDPITYRDLTNIARDTLRDAVRQIVKEREDLFVEFFNVAAPINIRLHAIELLRGVGKKTLKNLLRKREEKPFTSYDEVKRVLKIDPAEAIAERLLREIECGYGCDRQGRMPDECDDIKYFLFIEPCDPYKPYLGYLKLMWEARARRGRAAGAGAKAGERGGGKAQP